MDDEIIPRQRRQRPKDSFQNELQAKLHQRKYMGLSADITDSEDDGLGQAPTKGDKALLTRIVKFVWKISYEK